MVRRVQEQTDSLPLPWRPIYPAPSWGPVQAKALGSARACSLRNTNTRLGKLVINGKRSRVLDSSFLLFRFFAQHSLHNPDLCALTAVDVGHEVEQLSILARAGSVKQVFHHS